VPVISVRDGAKPASESACAAGARRLTMREAPSWPWQYDLLAIGLRTAVGPRWSRAAKAAEVREWQQAGVWHNCPRLLPELMASSGLGESQIVSLALRTASSVCR